MKIDFIGHPSAKQWDALCELWKEAFGDGDAFLEFFHQTAFHPERCCCLFADGQLAATLYWFDCSFQKKPVAYLYAIATAKTYQKKGLCHQLMEYVHKLLHEQGYAAAMLVPASPALRTFYEKMGYKTCTYISRQTCTLPEPPLSGNSDTLSEVPSSVNSDTLSENTIMPKAGSSTNSILETPIAHLQELDKSEYAQLRREYLPANSILQEKENLDFLETQMHFFYIKYDHCQNCICSMNSTLIAASKYGSQLHAVEVLGNSTYLPQILRAFDCQQGTFQFPGNEMPFAMWLPFQELDTEPAYFGFAFD